MALPEPQQEMPYMEEFFPLEPVESKYCYCNRVFNFLINLNKFSVFQ